MFFNFTKILLGKRCMHLEFLLYISIKNLSLSLSPKLILRLRPFLSAPVHRPQYKFTHKNQKLRNNNYDNEPFAFIQGTKILIHSFYLFVFYKHWIWISNHLLGIRDDGELGIRSEPLHRERGGREWWGSEPRKTSCRRRRIRQWIGWFVACGQPAAEQAELLQRCVAAELQVSKNFINF